MKIRTKLLAAAFMLAIASPASAALMSVTGPNSTFGTAAAIIGAPALATNAAVTNTGQQGFNERQGVLLGAAIATDFGGSIAAGMRVDSHMIFLNKPTVGSSITHSNVNWVFSGNIIGTMTDSLGNLEAASTPFLGAIGTTYQGPFTARGLEGGDGFSILGNVLTLTMSVSQPGDWIRVVTVSAVPLPAALPLLGAGLGLLGLMGWRRKRGVVAA